MSKALGGSKSLNKYREQSDHWVVIAESPSRVGG